MRTSNGSADRHPARPSQRHVNDDCRAATCRHRNRPATTTSGESLLNSIRTPPTVAECAARVPRLRHDERARPSPECHPAIPGVVLISRLCPVVAPRYSLEDDRHGSHSTPENRAAPRPIGSDLRRLPDRRHKTSPLRAARAAGRRSVTAFHPSTATPATARPQAMHQRRCIAARAERLRANRL